MMPNMYGKPQPIYGTNLVDGWQGAQSFEMIPNQTAILVDRSSSVPRIYFKSSNEYGMTKALTAYECTDITAQLQNNQNGVFDMSKYATKDEISDIVKAAITEILGGKPNESISQSGNGATN